MLSDKFKGTVSYGNYKKLCNSTYTKDDGAFTFECDNFSVKFTIAEAVAFADMVVSQLTDLGSMCIQQHMKPELIDLYHKSLDGK